MKILLAGLGSMDSAMCSTCMRGEARPRVVLDLGMIVGHRILPFVIDEPVPECDYAEGLPKLEEVLASLERATATTTSQRHPA